SPKTSVIVRYRCCKSSPRRSERAWICKSRVRARAARARIGAIEWVQAWRVWLWRASSPPEGERSIRDGAAPCLDVRRGGAGRAATGRHRSHARSAIITSPTSRTFPVPRISPAYRRAVILAYLRAVILAYRRAVILAYRRYFAPGHRLSFALR